jgi:hypothetical protein
MGSEAWGVFEDSEVDTLSETDKELLKRHVLHHVLTSADIHKIILGNPELLQEVTQNPEIKKKLRTKAGAMKRRLHK